MPIRMFGNQNVARPCDCLQSRRDVHGVAEYVAALHDDIAEIDADPELDPLLMRNVGIALCHAALQLERAADGIDRIAELGQQSVSGILDDAAAILGDFRIDQADEVLLEARVRALLVEVRQTAIACHIGGQDGGQSSLRAPVRRRSSSGRHECSVSAVATG